MSEPNKAETPKESAKKADTPPVVKPAAPAAAEPLSAAAIVTALGADRWRQKEFENPGHCIYVPYGTSIDDVRAPSFWANVAGKLRPGNTVEVHWDDFGQFAEFYVRSAGRNWASVALLRHVELEAAAAPQAKEQYGVAYNGVVDKFRITRMSDNAVIKAGFASELQARSWLEEYRRKLAA